MLTDDRLERIRKRHLTGEYASFKAAQDDVGDLLAGVDRLSREWLAAERRMEAACVERLGEVAAAAAKAAAEAERLTAENERLRAKAQAVIDTHQRSMAAVRTAGGVSGEDPIEMSKQHVSAMAELRATLTPPE